MLLFSILKIEIIGGVSMKKRILRILLILLAVLLLLYAAL